MAASEMTLQRPRSIAQGHAKGNGGVRRAHEALRYMSMDAREIARDARSAVTDLLRRDEISPELASEILRLITAFEVSQNIDRLVQRRLLGGYQRGRVNMRTLRAVRHAAG